MALPSNGCSALETSLLEALPIMTAPQRRKVIFLLLALATLLHVSLAGWGPIGNAREGWDTAVAWQSAQGEDSAALSGMWGVPVRPSLGTMLVAESFQLLGPTEFAARLPSALAALGICWLVYLIGERLGGLTRGLSAGLIAITTSGPMLHGKTVGGGSLTAFFITLGMYALLRMLEQTPRRGKWLALFWLGTTLALVSGGVAGLLLPATVLLPLPLLFRVTRLRLAIFGSAGGFALALLSGAIWFFWQQSGHDAAALSDSAHTRWGVLWMLFPWSVILLVPLFWRMGKILRLRDMEPGEGMLWIWLAVALGWALILPMSGEWPLSLAVLWPAAVLVAALVWERVNSGLRMLATISLVLAGATGLTFCGRVAGEEWLHLLQPIWWLSCGVMIVFGLAALLFVWQRHSLAALLALAAAVIPLNFNLVDAKARHSWNHSFREVAGILNVKGFKSPAVLLDDTPGAVGSFLFYAPSDARMRFQNGAPWPDAGFVLTPKNRLDFWQTQFPAAARLGENATHVLLKVGR